MQVEENKTEELKNLPLAGCKFLVVSSCDGAYNSYIVTGWQKLKRKVAAEYYFGPYEEAKKDDVVASVLQEMEDFDGQWEHGDCGPCRFKTREEQGYLEILRITD